MEMSLNIKYPDDYKPGKPDIVKNYATVSQIYAHPVSPTIINLAKNLNTNEVLMFVRIITLKGLCIKVSYEEEANVTRTV